MNESDDEKSTAALLGQLKNEPSAAARERAFARVSAEFQRGAGRRWTGWKIAAALLVVLGGGVAWQATRPGETVARLEAVDGALVARGSHWFSGASQTHAGAALSAGDSLTVSNDGGALLRISPDLTVRLGAGSHARLVRQDEIELAAGVAFVDATPGAHGALRIVTPHGVVTHLGTQYLVRSGSDETEVSVREGSAQLKSGAATAVAAAGEFIVQGEHGESVHSGKLLADDARFDWIAALPTEFKLDGATLGEFLTWFHRETGLAPIYAETLDGGHLRQVQLRGSIEHLEPLEALSLVLATADLAWHRDGAKIIIEQRSAKTG